MSPIEEATTSSSGEEYFSSEETPVRDNMDLEDIFSKLSKAHSKNNDKKLKSGKETYEELKREINRLPNIKDVPLTSVESEQEIRRRKHEITKIDDPIEAVLPNRGDSKITDKTVLKRKKTDEWFSMRKVELTEDLKKELSIIKYRQYLDPKRFYKKDKWEIPERFQMGTIIGGPADHFSNMSKRQRGKGFVEELLHDQDAKQWFKKTYDEIQVKRRSGGRGYYKGVVKKRRGN
ncbi:DEKNAAC101554 [Brettanomyces naardenensis]|uniref:DEKNAAC101554 n=1 Tax=Brettanomyces naardenensis TaxID=13370 RepID=A0A448YID6_BRENA|nr:DEKNAAC101554 [Brettanomyces naardenensis]